MKPFIVRRGQSNEEFAEGSPPDSYMVLGFVPVANYGYHHVLAICVGTDGHMTDVPIEELYVTGISMEMPVDFLEEPVPAGVR